MNRLFYGKRFSNRALTYLGLGSIAILGLTTLGKFNSNTSAPITKAAKAITEQASLAATYMKMPVLFESNKGQVAKEVNFLTRTGGYTMYFTPKEMVFDFRSAPHGKVKNGKIKFMPDVVPSSAVLRVQFVNANANPIVAGVDTLKTKTNYFIGNDPKKWQTNVPNYSKVAYQNIYPGIDMIFYGKGNQLEYDIKVAPYVDYQKAQLRFNGAEKLSLDKVGNLTISMRDKQTLHMHKPIVYQMINGIKHSIPGDFVLSANQQVGFKVGAYDKSKTLVIDPVIVYSTYLGGSQDNAGLGIAVDSVFIPNPAVYVTGYTKSADFPVTAGSFQDTNKGTGRSAFITKINREGNDIEYSTYLGGSGGNDEGFAIDVDGVGAAYITGETNSTDFPLQNPYQNTNKGARDFTAFVTKLNPEGNALVFSTYLGGSGVNQEGNAIVVDLNGFPYITGETTSTDFPLKNAFQSTNNGPKFTAYVTKFNTQGTDLIFSTYLGGSGGQDEGNGIDIDSDKNIYVTGETNSKDFPILSAIQDTPGPKGKGQTGFLTKFDPTGQGIIFSTYYGGSGGNDYPTAIDVGPNQNITIVGYTNSIDFPTFNSFQANNHATGHGRGFNGFIAKFNSLGNVVLFSSYIGGSGGDDRVLSVKVDALSQAHLTGWTNSTDFPVLNPVQATNNGPNITAIGARINSDGSLQSATYFGGSGGEDRGYAITVDSLLSSYATGSTNSPDLPLVNPIQSTHPASQMALVVKVGA